MRSIITLVLNRITELRETLHTARLIREMEAALETNGPEHDAHVMDYAMINCPIPF